MTEPRRFLIATTVAHHEKDPSLDIPDMAVARDEIIDLFTNVLGYEHVAGLGLDPTKDQLTGRLREFCRAKDRRDDDLVAVYIGMHGEVLDSSQQHVLYTADVDPDDLDDALPTAELARKMLQGTAVRRVLLMLDTCYSARGGGELVDSALARMTSNWGEQPGSGLVVLTSAQPAQEAKRLAFPRLLRSAVDDMSANGFIGPTLPIEFVVDAMNSNVARPQYQTISSTLAQLTGEVPAFLPNPGHAVPAEPDDRMADDAYRYVAGAYLSWAWKDWRSIELGDLGRDQDDVDVEDRRRDLPLERMYISLQADPRSPTDRSYEDELRHRDRGAMDSDTARTLHRQEAIDAVLSQGRRSATEPGGVSDADSTSDEGTTLEDAFNRHRLLVVLGHPGSGKSVLCQWLGYELAWKAQGALRRREPDAFRMPIRFRVADYAQAQAGRLAAGEPVGDFAEFLAGTLPAEVGYPADRLQAMFDRALADGDGVLIIDGLDELTNYRNEILHALVEVVEDYVLRDGGKQTQAVITSRIAGYDDVQLGLEQAAHYLIRPMAPDQIEQFVIRFFKEIRAQDQAEIFLNAVGAANPSVRRLASTPLLLMSLCSYWHRHYRLPASRAKLYRQLVLDTGYRWRRFTAAGADTPLDRLLRDESVFLDMLSRVAVRIHDEHVDGRMDERELIDTLDDALYEPARLLRVDVRTAAGELVTRIKERVGILAEFSNGDFGFIHQTFREYLAGLDLLSEPEKMFGNIAERIDDPRWREPVLLMLGECDSEARMALAERATAELPRGLENWVEIFLAAALERPPTETGAAELTSLLKLAVATYDTVGVGDVDAVEALDYALAELRQHIGSGLFDFLALGVAQADKELTATVAGLYWRQRWLTEAVVTVLAELDQHDSEKWSWPIQRALRAVAGPPPRMLVTIRDKLVNPADLEPDQIDATSVRMYEAGSAAWERKRRQADRVVVDPPPAGLLRVRELLVDHPDLWTDCLAQQPSARVLIALFGGLDHQDAIRWADEYEDFALLLGLGDPEREVMIERRADEFVPRFGVGDTVYDIAVALDTQKVDLGKPEPELSPLWMTRPSTPQLRSAVRRWLRRSGPDPDSLREVLRTIADQPGVDRAEAELGLLVLDGTPTTPGARSEFAVGRALEATGDAMLRGHAEWFRLVWAPESNLTSAERGALHHDLLHLFCRAAGRPVGLRTELTTYDEHPVLAAEALARAVLARSWGADPTEIPLHQDLHAVVGWLTTLPYPTGIRPLLWHEDMRRAGVAAAAVFPIAAKQLFSWFDHLNPWSGVDARQFLQSVVAGIQTMPDDRDTDDVPGALRELYQLLADGGRVNDDHLRMLREVAETVAAPYTDLAFLAVGLAQNLPEADRADWHRSAVDLLTGEPNEPLLAESLRRVRAYLTADRPALEAADRLAASLTSPILRAHAAGDRAGAAAELVAKLGAELPPALPISLLAGARLVVEADRLQGLARTGSRDETGDLLPSTLDEPGLRALSSDLTDEDETLRVLTAVSHVTDDAVAALSALVAQAPAQSKWVRVADALLRLNREEREPDHPDVFRDLIEVVRSADANNATTAFLILLGQQRRHDRDRRHHSLAKRGVDAWLRLGGDATDWSDSFRRRLCTAALMEFDIDDPDAVREALRRVGAGELDALTWRTLVESSTLWSEECQDLAAGWLGGITEPADAAAGLRLVAILSTAGHTIPVSAALIESAIQAALRTGTTVGTIIDPDSSRWRTAVARPIFDACISVLGNGLAGADAIAEARRTLDAHAIPVIRSHDGEIEQHLDAYGKLAWVNVGARPGDVGVYVAAEVRAALTIPTMAEWLRRLDAECDGAVPYDFLDFAVLEALLCLLVVLSGLDVVAFRLACPPQTMQPLLSRYAVQGGSLVAPAALTLLGRLQYVDFVPASGPTLMDVVDVAMRLDPLGRTATIDFFREVRHLRGDSPTLALLERIESTVNETVAQGFAALAVAYLRSPTCSRSDGRLIRQALVDGIGHGGRNRAVRLSGTGSDDNPVTAVLGPERRTEFRRLLRVHYDVEDR